LIEPGIKSLKAPRLSQLLKRQPTESMRGPNNADGRRFGWVSGSESPYQADYKCQGDTDDMQWPVMHVFMKRDGKIFHFWGTESSRNHLDTVWPYWNLMDFTPEGRPDIPTPPQTFRSEFLEKTLSEQKIEWPSYAG
jgi:predicted dithiol-disulfide oxidoreductase (DUF899 family)